MRKNKTAAQRTDSIFDWAVVNSSYVVFFIAATVGWAWVFCSYFPVVVQAKALMLMIAFSFMMFLVGYMIMQFYRGVTILQMIVLYFSVIALLSFLSAVRGPVADGEIPTIHFLMLGPYAIAGAGLSPITASVFTFYGVVTWGCARMTAAVLEWLYTRVVARLFPVAVRRSLSKIDAGLDTSASRVSLDMFTLYEKRGMAIFVGLLAVYAVLFTVLLIA